jgi:hypothetical protein
MNIAMVYGGQPRFTYEFIDLMRRLKGFDTADIYMVLWRSDWAQTDEEAIRRIEKVLLPRYRIGNIVVVDEPDHEFPPGCEHLSPPRDQNVAWWYHRLYIQCLGLSWAFDLIDQPYDAVIRFRGDGSVDRELDISKIAFDKTPLLTPNNGRAGFPDFKINDQFAVGTQDMIKFYCDLGKHIKELVSESDPDWNKSDILDGTKWTWGKEHLLGYRMRKHGIPLHVGDFGVTMNAYGRSRFTDKHYHHGIAKDPTDL